MVYSPRLGVTQNFPVAKWAQVNASFCHPADKAVLHMKLVATHGSMVYLPRFGVTQNLSVAKWAHVHVGFCHYASVLHRKSVPASAAMIYSTCTHGASHTLHCGQMYSHRFLFCVAFPSFAGTVAFSLGLAPSFSLACKSVCPSRALSCLVCSVFALLCSLLCFLCFGDVHLSFPFLCCSSSLDIRDGHFCSVVLSAFCCLRLCFLRLPAFLFSIPFCFRDGSPDIRDGTCLFLFRCLTATFACVAATRCTALLMLPRGMGHFQQLLQTWSPLQEPCCASHALKAHAAYSTLHTLHLHQPQALREQSKHTLPPLRARCHAVYFQNFSSVSTKRVSERIYGGLCAIQQITH